jgi:hypothetical protein
MTLQQIDDALAAWNERLGVISQNLLELQQEPTYRLLTGHGGATKAQVSGATEARVEPALRAMLTMFQHFGELHSTIENAAKIREQLPALFGGEPKIREIEHLLFERSIRLPAVEVPLSQRTLLSGAQSRECVSPSELVEAMTRSFADARDAVLAVDHAWRDVFTMTDEVAVEVEREGTPQVALMKMLQQIQEEAKADPLGALAHFGARVQPVLDRARKAAELSREVQRTLVRAQGELEELMRVHGEAESAAAEARAKIEAGEAIPAPSSDEVLKGLDEWLRRLERKAAEGLFDSVSVGLRNWKKAADECLAHEQAALGAGRKAMRYRDELRGRFDALKAKARAYGVAETVQFAQLAGQAEAFLYAHPANLQRAALVVADYERVLSGTGRGREA